MKTIPLNSSYTTKNGNNCFLIKANYVLKVIDENGKSLTFQYNIPDGILTVLGGDFKKIYVTYD
jgi:hypothetical protein